MTRRLPNITNSLGNLRNVTNKMAVFAELTKRSFSDVGGGNARGYDERTIQHPKLVSTPRKKFMSHRNVSNSSWHSNDKMSNLGRLQSLQQTSLLDIEILCHRLAFIISSLFSWLFIVSSARYSQSPCKCQGFGTAKRMQADCFRSRGTYLKILLLVTIL